jgi:hypothetical protein
MNTNLTTLAEKGIFFPGTAENFAQESSDKYFRLEITNEGTSAEDKIICLCPGNYISTAELSALGIGTIAAIIGDGTIDNTSGKEIVCTGEPGSVESWKRFFLRHPSRFVGMSLEVSSTTQLSQVIKVYKDDPYNANLVPITQINPNAYKTNQIFNDKLVHIPLDHFQLDNETIVIVTIKAGATLTLTLTPGAFHNENLQLENEARKEWMTKGIKRSYKQ